MGRWRARRTKERRISSIPLVVLITTLLSWHFFRLSVFFSVPLTCMPTYDFWTRPAGSSWPLFGSFTLVFTLLFIWIGALCFDLRNGNRTDMRLVALCGLVVTAIGACLWFVLGAIQLNYYTDDGGYASWLREPPWLPGPSVCDEAKPYLGGWEVVSIEVPFLGQEFPYESVEFRRDLSLVASYGRFRKPVEGYWGPPQHWRQVGWITTDEIDGAWTWKLSGDTIFLSTPEEWEEPISRVVLRRLASPPSVECANNLSC